jgi:hypothetical protein
MRQHLPLHFYHITTLRAAVLQPNLNQQLPTLTDRHSRLPTVTLVAILHAPPQSFSLICEARSASLAVENAIMTYIISAMAYIISAILQPQARPFSVQKRSSQVRG